MKFRGIAFTAYFVRDLPRARLFYEGTLALKPLRASETIAEYAVGSDRFHIMVEPADRPNTEATGIHKTQFARSRHAAFEVEDFAAAVQRLKERGCVFVAPPQEHESGFAMTVIADPDGNFLMIQRSIPAKPAKKAKAGAKGKRSKP
jgi:extradiol dioxygenase family protein